MGTIHLVSCAARKQPVPAPAKCLYTSALFRKARSHVVGTSLPWFILSAEYGLVRPDEVIAPYDRTLNTMSVADRRRWARRVLMQLESHLEGVTEVVFLAGLRYREFLTPSLHRRGLLVSVPMQGFRIGEQLRWLSGLA